jgi:hypothetical protein
MLDLGGDEPDAGGRQVEWCRAVQPPTAGEEPFELRDVRWGDGLGGGDRESELCAERSRPTTTALIANRARHLDEAVAPHTYGMRYQRRATVTAASLSAPSERNQIPRLRLAPT